MASYSRSPREELTHHTLNSTNNPIHGPPSMMQGHPHHQQQQQAFSGQTAAMNQPSPSGAIGMTMSSRRPSYTAEFSSRPRLLDQQPPGPPRHGNEQRWSIPGTSNLWSSSAGPTSVSGPTSTAGQGDEPSPGRRDSILVPRFAGSSGPGPGPGPGPLETFEEEALSEETYVVSEDPLINPTNKPGQSKHIPSATSTTYSRFTSLGAIGQGSSVWGSPNSRRHSYAGEYMSMNANGVSTTSTAPPSNGPVGSVSSVQKSMSVSAASSAYTHLPPGSQSDESHSSASPPATSVPASGTGTADKSNTITPMRPVSGNHKIDDTINRYFSVDSLNRNTSNAIILSSDPSADMYHINVDVTTLISVPSQRLYLVEFKCARLDVFYLPDGSSLNLRPGDLVIVDADRGKDLGKVVKDNVSIEEAGWLKLRRYQEQQAVLHAPSGPSSSPSNKMPSPTSPTIPSVSVPKQILRLAQPGEAQQILTKQADEEKAVAICLHKVRERGLDMTVVDAEYQWDRRKLTFFYSASHRIDFRDLVRELFRVYKTRIWMCAVGSGSTTAGSTASADTAVAVEGTSPHQSAPMTTEQRKQQRPPQTQQQQPMPIPGTGIPMMYGQMPSPFMQHQVPSYTHITNSPTQTHGGNIEQSQSQMIGQSHWKRGMAPNVPPSISEFGHMDIHGHAIGPDFGGMPTGAPNAPPGSGDPHHHNQGQFGFPPVVGFPQHGQYWYSPSTY